MKLVRANCARRPLDRQWMEANEKNESAPAVEKNRGGELCGPLFMRNTDGLAGLAAKIAGRLAIKPEIFIIHPAELRILGSMSDQDLREFAAQNGWRIVRRLGGRQIEFYNDASAREKN